MYRGWVGATEKLALGLYVIVSVNNVSFSDHVILPTALFFFNNVITYKSICDPPGMTQYCRVWMTYQMIVGAQRHIYVYHSVHAVILDLNLKTM